MTAYNYEQDSAGMIWWFGGDSTFIPVADYTILSDVWSERIAPTNKETGTTTTGGTR